MTRLRAGRRRKRGSVFRRRQEIYVFSRASAPRPTQPSIQWVLGRHRPGHEAKHSRPPSSAVMNESSYTFVPHNLPWRAQGHYCLNLLYEHIHDNTSPCFFMTFLFYVKYFPPIRENFTLFSIFVTGAGEIFN